MSDGKAPEDRIEEIICDEVAKLLKAHGTECERITAEDFSAGHADGRVPYRFISEPMEDRTERTVRYIVREFFFRMRKYATAKMQKPEGPKIIDFNGGEFVLIRHHWVGSYQEKIQLIAFCGPKKCELSEIDTSDDAELREFRRRKHVEALLDVAIYHPDDRNAVVFAVVEKEWE